MSYVNKVDGYFIRLSNGDYLSVFDLDIVKEKTMEVTKLKELLKDCRDELDKYDSYTDFNEVGRYKLLIKINEALKW